MSTPFPLLGQADGSGFEWSLGNAVDRMSMIFRPDELLDAVSDVPLIVAAISVTVGVLCVLNGYRWHKWLIAVLAFLFGIGIGYKLSEQMGRSMVVAGAIGCLCAIVATPLLRVAVALFGGLTGAFIGVNTWTAVESAPTDANWAGALIGFVALAMLSMVLFRLVIVLFTSVGGAAMVVIGGVGLLVQVPGWDASVRESLNTHHAMLPLLLLLAAVTGFVIQESRLRSQGVSIVRNQTAEE